MKIEKEDLVKLVLSLTARERQEFAMLYPNNYDYVELYRYILKHKDLDEKKFVDYLSQIKTAEEPQKKVVINLSMTKSYLLEKILNSLRSSYKTPSTEVYNSLTYSEILKRKGLYHSAQNYLEEANSIAKNNDLFLEELIYARQRLILEHFDFSDKLNLMKLIEEERYYSNLIFNADIALKSFSVLQIGAAALYHRIFPDEIFFENIKILENVKDDSTQSKLVKLILWIAQFTFLQAQEREDESNQVLAKVFNLWSTSPDFLQFNGHLLIKFAHAFLFHYAISSKKTDLNQYFDTLIQLLIAFEKMSKSNTEVFRAKEAKMVLKLAFYFFNKQHDTDLKIITLKVGFDELSNENYKRMRMFVVSEKFAFMVIHLRLKEYKETLSYANQFLNNKDIDIKLYNMVYPFIHFSYLRAHYELGHFRFLKYELEKSKNLLIKANCFRVFEEEFFNLMKMLINTSPKHPSFKLILGNFKNRFEQLKEEKELKNYLYFFDVLEWIDDLMIRVFE